METIGIVEVVRKQQQDWEEMRNMMLAEREENQVVLKIEVEWSREKSWVSELKSL